MALTDYKDYERMAILALRAAKLPVDSENIGEVIHFIMAANEKFNSNIGNIYGFRKMYINFAILKLRTERKKRSKTVLLENYINFESKLCYKDFYINLFWEDLEKRLKKTEYDLILKRFRYGKTFKEIGMDMGCSTQYAQNNYHKILQKLKRNYV